MIERLENLHCEGRLGELGLFSMEKEKILMGWKSIEKRGFLAEHDEPQRKKYVFSVRTC